MKLRLALAAVGIAAVAAQAQAAPATANATASATIVGAQQLSKTRDLAFGTIAKPTSGTSTITVASGAAATTTPTVSGGNATIPNTGQASSAAFRITAAAGDTFTITDRTLSFPSAGSNLTNIGSETPATSGLNQAGGTFTMTGSEADLFIGGHFDITPTTAEGTYNGTLGLTINFN